MKHIQADTWTRSRSNQSPEINENRVLDSSITAAFLRTIKP
jgi:hypothetical protein